MSDSLAPARAWNPRLVLGWREWLSLPQLGVPRIHAKVDSGARSSCLHVSGHEAFDQDGARFVRFMLEAGADEDTPLALQAAVVAERVVTDSGGHRQCRVFIRTLLQLPTGQSWPIELNLTERRHMQFPMLLGRTALRRRCLVEPARSHLLGIPAPEIPS